MRTRFAKEIVAEFAAPRRDTGRVIIFCGGMPSVPRSSETIAHWVRRDFWVIAPRYRGTWESGGRFLRRSPHLDVLDVISQLPHGFTDLRARRRYRITPRKLVLFGSSFGGPAVILASRDPRVDKVVAVSPVVDWLSRSRSEPLGWLGRYVRLAFGEGYRFSPRDWEKLAGGTFYNPMAHVAQIPGDKLLVIHARDDEVVRWSSVYRFVQRVNCEFLSFAKGGHLSHRFLCRPNIERRIRRFLRR